MTLCGQTRTHVPHSQQLPYATTSFIICLKVGCSMGRGTLLTGLLQCQLRVLPHHGYGARAMLSRAEARTVAMFAEALLPAVDAFPIGAAEVDMPGRVAGYLAH